LNQRNWDERQFPANAPLFAAFPCRSVATHNFYVIFRATIRGRPGLAGIERMYASALFSTSIPSKLALSEGMIKPDV
jgi:hypothetical protein